MEIEGMSGQAMKNFTLALATCLSLGAVISFASVLPCGYHDAADGKFAGYGYHSLAKVASEGFEWNAGNVPEPYEKYSGTGPYIASAEYWVVALYIPIFIGIIFLGWLILGGKERLAPFIHLSRKSGRSQG